MNLASTQKLQQLGVLEWLRSLFISWILMRLRTTRDGALLQIYTCSLPHRPLCGHIPACNCFFQTLQEVISLKRERY